MCCVGTLDSSAWVRRRADSAGAGMGAPWTCVPTAASAWLCYPCVWHSNLLGDCVAGIRRGSGLRWLWPSTTRTQTGAHSGGSSAHQPCSLTLNTGHTSMLTIAPPCLQARQDCKGVAQQDASRCAATDSSSAGARALHQLHGMPEVAVTMSIGMLEVAALHAQHCTHDCKHVTCTTTGICWAG